MDKPKRDRGENKQTKKLKLIKPKVMDLSFIKIVFKLNN